MNRSGATTSGQPVTVSVIDRRGKEILQEKFSSGDTVGHLKAMIKEKRRLGAERQYLTIPKPGGTTSDNSRDDKIVLKENYQTLDHYGITGSATVTLKDLGPQVSWTTVFLVEYFGPILMFGLNYLISCVLHKNIAFIQKIGTLLAILHFAKREYETVFVHIFGNDTMPFKRIFINSAHYWILCGLLISVELNFFWTDPGYSTVVVYALAGFWAVFEFLNFMCHVTLRNLRTKKPAGDEHPDAAKRRRGIPRGWGFDIVSCANYWWETLVWVTFSILVRCWTSYLFTLVSFLQMADWALKKHRQYRKEFTGEEGKEKYPRGRKAIVPFVL